MEANNECDDPFFQHFQCDLSEKMATVLNNNPEFELLNESWPSLGKLLIKLPKIENQKSDGNIESALEDTKSYAKPALFPNRIDNPDWNRFFIKQQIHQNLLKAINTYVGGTKLTAFQLELLSLIYEYKDLYFTEESFSNQEEIRFIYCLHVVNHVLKTRLKILHHNARLSDKTEIPDEFRDQGLVRPKVLILVPFRNSALKIVNMLCAILLPNSKDNIVNKKRFMDEFTGNDISVSQKKSKPQDFVNTFAGNIDDHFKVGISITKKSLKLYADFYTADIILASPLGLRMVIGAEGESDRDYDFLTSIEVLIIDQTEIFLMQNWDHILHIMDHLHLQPKESHGTNFARVRSWAINSWSRFYRQTLVFSAHPLPQISALFSRKCSNYSGSVRTINPTTLGTISQVITRVPQIFYRLKESSATDTIDNRFELFIQTILPQYQDNSLGHVLIYVPSYFDFVRLRNYFMAEMISFVHISEYAKEGKVSEARDKFYHQEANFMLYSERFHFYHRRKIRGIQHLIFYQLPTFPHFYSEICNLMQVTRQSSNQCNDYNMTISAIYSKYDTAQLSAIVSSERAIRLFSSDKHVHMFTTNDI